MAPQRRHEIQSIVKVEKAMRLDNQQRSPEEGNVHRLSREGVHAVYPHGNGVQSVNFYALELDGMPYYVGKTVKPIKYRLSGHICSAKRIINGKADYKKVRSKVNSWLVSIIKKGKKPEIRLIETFLYHEEWEWKEREKFWIAHFREHVPHLKNLSEGGEGTAGYKQPRALVERRAAAIRGRKRPDVSIYMRKRMKGRNVSDETRMKIIQSMGKPVISIDEDGKETRYESIQQAGKAMVGEERMKQAARSIAKIVNGYKVTRRFKKVLADGKEKTYEYVADFSTYTYKGLRWRYAKD